MSTFAIQRYLDEKRVKYSLISHPTTYTAQETAKATHIAGRGLVKTVVVKIDDKPALVLEPATSRVKLGRLKQAIGAGEVRLAEEQEIAELFPDCEVGAMPPFGSLYKMDVYIDEALTHVGDIAFNAGSHTELIKLAYRDFAELEHPQIIAI